MLLGAIIGLATLTRGEGLALIALLAWPAAYGPVRGRGLRLLATTAASVLVIAPWVTRNLVVFHRLTLATDANTLIAGANCHDTYYGHDIGWWSLECLARGRTRSQLLAGDASSSAAFDYASDHVPRLPLVARFACCGRSTSSSPCARGITNRVAGGSTCSGSSSTTRCCCSRAWVSRVCASAGGCSWLQCGWW